MHLFKENPHTFRKPRAFLLNLSLVLHKGPPEIRQSSLISIDLHVEAAQRPRTPAQPPLWQIELLSYTRSVCVP